MRDPLEVLNAVVDVVMAYHPQKKRKGAKKKSGKRKARAKKN